MEKRSRGRPRDEEARDRITAAALAIAKEGGLGALTMEAIAAAAGASKQTLYRWWPSRADVLLEGLRNQAAADIEVPRSASLRRGLEKFLVRTFEVGKRAGTAGILSALMAEAQRDADFRTRFRESFIDSRRKALRAVFENATDLRAGFDIELGIDLAFGVLWYRLLLQHGPLDERLGKQLAEAISRAAIS